MVSSERARALRATFNIRVHYLLIASYALPHSSTLRTTHQVGFREHYAWEDRFDEGISRPLSEGNPNPNGGGASTEVTSCTEGDLPGGSRKRKAGAEAAA